MTIFKPMVVPLAPKGGEICTGQIILQPILLKSDRLPGKHVRLAALRRQHLHIRIPHRLQDEVVCRSLAGFVGDANNFGIARHPGLDEYAPDVFGGFQCSVGIHQLGMGNVNDFPSGGLAVTFLPEAM